MVSTREQRRKTRHEGGPDYHDVKARKTGLFVRATRVDIGVLSDGEWLSFDAERALKLSGHARLHHCACGAWFIDHWAAKTCLACRKATILARARAYTAERAAQRKTASAPPGPLRAVPEAHAGRARETALLLLSLPSGRLPRAPAVTRPISRRGARIESLQRQLKGGAYRMFGTRPPKPH